MLILGGVAANRSEARAQLQAAVESGSGLEVFAKVIEAQGGDPSVLEDPSLLPSAGSTHTVVADRAGFVERCDALVVGRSAVRLGAGRQAKEDDVDPGVGITINAKVGDAVAAGDALATVRYNTALQLSACLPVLEPAWVIADEAPPSRPLILGEVK